MHMRNRSHWLTDVSEHHYVLIKALPLFSQSFFQVVDVTDRAAVDAPLLNNPNNIVYRVEVWDVRWPLQWVYEVASGAIVSRARWAEALSCRIIIFIFIL